MSVSASGDRDPAPVEPTPLDPTPLDPTPFDQTRPDPTRPDPTRPDPMLSDPTLSDPTLWVEPTPPVYPGFAAYPAQYPPSYPDLGSGPSPAGYPPPVKPSPVYPSPPYPPRGYPPRASYPPYGVTATGPTNSFAIAALVLSFAFWPAGIVFGHVARRQIARSGESGRGLASAALVIAYLHFAFTALLIVAGVAGGG